MIELVFILEEESAAALIKSLLPRLINSNIINSDMVNIKYIIFDGKSDLDKKLGKKLSGYQNQEARFIIMRDQDNSDCKDIKQKLQNIAANSTKKPFFVRIACRSLESWYLAQLDSVEKGLQIKNLAKSQNRKRLRNPDSIVDPDKYLNSLCNNKYTKIAGSRQIGKYLDLESTLSPSFKNFISAIRKILSPEM
jgi:hypothetical protein